MKQHHIKWICVSFIALVFLAQLLITLKVYLNGGDEHLSDWLINYQVGFIRRGLLGELLLKISQIFRLNIVLMTSLLVALMHSIFFMSIFSLIKNEKFNPLYLPLFLSPFFLAFQPIHGLVGRKEIILFALISMLILLKRKFDEKDFDKVIFIVLSTYPLFILSYEVLALFLPYIFIIYMVDKKKINLKTYLGFFLLTLPSIAAFYFSIKYRQLTITEAKAMAQSIIKAGFAVNNLIEGVGTIRFLTWSLEYHDKMVWQSFITGSKEIPQFFLQIFLSCCAFIPLRRQFSFFIENKKTLLLFFISLSANFFLLFRVGDTGRFVNMNLVLIGLLCFLTKAKEVKKEDSLLLRSLFNSNRKKSFLALIILFTYSQVWHLPLFVWSEQFKLNFLRITKHLLF